MIGQTSEKRITGRMIVIHDGNLLLMERWRDGLHYYSIPGGGVEPDETPEEAAVRELFEETGIRVTIRRNVYKMDMPDSLHHIFLGKYLSGEPMIQQDAPEMRRHDTVNRYKPCWVPVSAVAGLPFNYWRPLQPVLVRHLANGFPATVTHLYPQA